jgi:D-hexose-6-phosphate mutarotase
VLICTFDVKIKIVKHLNFRFRNPWDKNKLGDMGDDDYKRFICVEAAQNSRRIHIRRDETWTANHTTTLSQD